MAGADRRRTLARRAHLMKALYRSGRQADALAVYQETRALLVGQLGIEPSPLLQRLERDILRQTPELEQAGVPTPIIPAQSTRPVRKTVTVAVAELVPTEPVSDPEARARVLEPALATTTSESSIRVSRMSRYAQDSSPRMRIDVADIIFLSGDPQGVQVVAPLLTDQDKQVALAAERATMRLKTDR